MSSVVPRFAVMMLARFWQHSCWHMDCRHVPRLCWHTVVPAGMTSLTTTASSSSTSTSMGADACTRALGSSTPIYRQRTG